MKTLFWFDEIMNEHNGANLRNRIARGIMNDEEGNSDTRIFFVGAVIKLLLDSKKHKNAD